MADQFDPADVAAAEIFDAEIDAVLGGRAGPDTDRTLVWLAAVMRTEPPRSVAQRVAGYRAAEQRRLWKPARIVAAVMGWLFIYHGFSNLVIGAWVAENLGEAYSPHAMNEGGLALIGAGLAVAAGAISRRFMPVSTAVGVPLGLAFFVIGITEVQQFPLGAVLHLSQGVTGIVLAWTFWRFWRYDADRNDE